MSVTTAVKQVSIATGTYRPVRWLSRRMRPSKLRAFHEDVELYRALLPPAALCFDVGANVGRKSEALLRAGAARVVAFEPNPRVVPELLARCAHWKNWTLVQAALGSAPALATLYAREFHGQSGLSKEWETGIIATYPVPVLTLDAAIQHFGHPFYCKIDVEGWELEVLKGLNQRLPLLSFEFHLMDQDIRKTVACLQRLSRFGSGEVNLTPAEASTLHLTEWHQLERFLGWFPGDLERSLPNIYGDIFVKSDPA